MNLIVLEGILTRDPEGKATVTGTPMVILHLATTETRILANGTPEARTVWHSIAVFGKKAVACEKYLYRGRRISVEGKIHTRSWQAADGSTCYATGVNAHIVRFLDAYRPERALSPAVAPEREEKVDEDLFEEDGVSMDDEVCMDDDWDGDDFDGFGGCFDLAGGGPYARGEFNEWGFRIEK